MIDKILDRYYMKKVLRELSTTPYLIDIKTEIKKRLRNNLYKKDIIYRRMLQRNIKNTSK